MKGVIVNCLMAPFRKYPFPAEFSFSNIPALTEVDILEELDSFYKIEYDDEWGYVEKCFIALFEGENEKRNSVNC